MVWLLSLSLFLYWMFCDSDCMRRFRRFGVRVVLRSCFLLFWRKSGGESRNGIGRRGSERSCG